MSPNIIHTRALIQNPSLLLSSSSICTNRVLFIFVSVPGTGGLVSGPEELARDIYSFISDCRRAEPYRLLHIPVVADRRGESHQGTTSHARRRYRGRTEAEAGQRQLD